MLSGEGPIFLQLAQRIADDIINGTYTENSGIPSTTDFAVFYQMSPITSAKGINMLVDQGVLYKKRGIGMFVAPGARQQLLAERKAAFTEQHIAPLLHEAKLLGIGSDDLADMIKEKDQS